MIRKTLIICILALVGNSQLLQAQNQYCVPILSSGCATDYIASVQFAGLSNPSGNCSSNANSYTNHDASSYTAEVFQGQDVGFTVTTGLTYSQYIGVWIDYNNDGDFDDESEFVASSSNRVFALAGTIAIPDIYEVNGLRRLRVRCIWDTQLNAQSGCSDAVYGETEDYTITISPMTMFGGGHGDGYFQNVTSFTTPFVPNHSGGMGDGYALINGELNSPFVPSLTGGVGDGYNLNQVTHLTALVPGFNGGTGDGYAVTPLFYSSSLTPNLNGGTADGYHLAPIMYQTVLSPQFTGGPGDGYSFSPCNHITALQASFSGGTADGYGMDSASVSLDVVCIPVANAGCSAYGGDYIDQVVLNTLNNAASGCNGNANGYVRYQPEEYTTTLTQGENYTMHLQTGAGNPEFLGIWVDWNNDNDFDDQDELMARTLSAVNSLDVDFSVPLNQPIEGERRMRVRCAFVSSFPPLGSCQTVQWGETEDYYLNIVSPAPKLLTVKMLLQGLATSSGVMEKARDDDGFRFQSDTADQVTISLREANAPFAQVGTFPHKALLVNGDVICTVPGYFTSSYYLTIQHRNHLETWSAMPVSFAGGTISYNFTDAASRAFSSNQISLGGGVWGFYAGDADHDGDVDNADMVLISTEAAAFRRGYEDADLNGDGVVDALDLIVGDNNAADNISRVTP